jgi:hypothetical protein
MAVLSKEDVSKLRDLAEWYWQDLRRTAPRHKTEVLLRQFHDCSISTSGMNLFFELVLSGENGFVNPHMRDPAIQPIFIAVIRKEVPWLQFKNAVLSGFSTASHGGPSEER